MEKGSSLGHKPAVTIFLCGLRQVTQTLWVQMISRQKLDREPLGIPSALSPDLTQHDHTFKATGALGILWLILGHSGSAFLHLT